MLPLQVRVDLGVMAMKRYSALPRSQELDPHHQMQFSGHPSFGGSNSSAVDTITLFYAPPTELKLEYQTLRNKLKKKCTYRTLTVVYNIVVCLKWLKSKASQRKKGCHLFPAGEWNWWAHFSQKPLTYISYFMFFSFWVGPKNKGVVLLSQWSKRVDFSLIGCRPPLR